MSGNRKKNIKKQIRRYMTPLLIINFFWVLATIYAFTKDIGTGVVMLIATVIFVVFVVIIYAAIEPKILEKLVEYGMEYSQVQRQIIKEMDVPFGLLDEDGVLLWLNNAFVEMVGEKDTRGKNIKDIIGGIKDEQLDFSDTDSHVFEIKYAGGEYNVKLKRFGMEESISDEQEKDSSGSGGHLISISIEDITRLRELEEENKSERMAAGQIFIDNYDETVQSIEPARRTLMVALIDRKINQYFGKYDGIVRKLETDKYFVVFKAGYISSMQSDKFSVLDDVKTVNIGNGMPVTLSIGIGTGENTMAENNDQATRAIDMALGRGGDQAVLRQGNKAHFYGGKSKSVESNSRVKVRVRATAFRDLIDRCDKIFIMGHHIGDNDSFGTSVGFYRIARTIGKKSHIIIGEMGSSVKPFLEEFREKEEYPEDMFIDGRTALDIMDKQDGLIVVDTSRASYTEYPELVRRSQCLMVFDHHRQASDVIDNAQLMYVEPAASSACEMVVEIMQYIKENVRLSKLEAEVIYSGIMVDTNNFINRTSSRTFEAAAYLRKNGADVSRVRKMFRKDLRDYKAKARAIENAEIYKDTMIFSICKAENTTSPTIVGSQVANELLEIKDIKAAFVFTPYNDLIYISARSTDTFNVQVIMEELGGGGHMNLAGTQLKNVTAAEAVNMVKNIVDKKISEGEIE